MTKDDMTISVDLMNLDSSEALYKNCAVSGITFDTEDLSDSTKVTLSGSLPITMSKTEAATHYSDLDTTSDTGSGGSYTAFTFDDYGKIDGILWKHHFSYWVGEDGHNKVTLEYSLWNYGD